MPETISSSWPCDIEGPCKEMGGKILRIGRIKRRNNYTKSRRHAWVTINLGKKKLDQLKNCPQFARTLFQHVFFFLARIGRPDVVWSVNKLARAVT